MKALVLWAEPHSTNLGVQVLGQGMGALIERAWPGAQVSYQGYGPGPAPIRIAHTRRLVREAFTWHSELRDWVSSFDLVLDARGGDSFADIYGLERLVAMSAMAEFVRRQRVPYVLGPQTIGPFTTPRGRLIGRWTLRRATQVMARDSHSAEYSRSLGRTVDATSTDVAFALPVPAPSGASDVLLNVSGLLWNPNPHVDSAAYRTLVTALVLGLQSAGRHVTLLAHVLDSTLADNDVPALRELAAGLGPVPVVVPRSLAEVREVIAGSQVLIGSRMHACLNALSVGVPAISLAYSRKFEPLLADLGWTHTVDLRDGSEQLERTLELAATDLGRGVPDVLARASRRLEYAVDTLRTAL